MIFSRTHCIWRAVADWIRAVLLRKTATPYECYWRDRAYAAESEARWLRGQLRCYEPVDPECP